MKQQNKTAQHTSRAQAGNALFIVIIGVVLFASLILTFSKGIQQSNSGISNRQADLAASEILDFASRYDRGVGLLLSRQCSEGELNFANEMVTPSNNTSAPSDNRCDFFHPNGAGLSATKAPDQWLNQSFSSLVGYGLPIIGGDTRMDGIGGDTNTDQDLILWIAFVNKSVCEAINKKLALPDPMPSFTAGPYAGLYFRGTYTNTWSASLSTPGLTTACAYKPSGSNALTSTNNSAASNQPMDGSYHFYHVLLAR